MISILDTIDHAIADHELSADAMRWTPEPPNPAAGGSVAGPVAAFAESMNYVVQEWQRRILNSQITVRINAYAELMVRSISDATKGLTFTFGPLIDEPRRTERTTRMRRAYRARRGRRW